MLYSFITALVMRIVTLRGSLRTSHARYLGGRRSVGGAIHVGGYANEGLNNLIAGPYDVWSLDLGSDEFDLDQSLELIDQAIDANVHKGKLKVVFGPDAIWHGDYLRNNFQVLNVPKGSKRHNDILAPRALSTMLDFADILEVDMSTYNSPMVADELEEELEKLHDGALIVNRDTVFEPAVEENEERLRSNRWTFVDGQWQLAEEPYSEFQIKSMMRRFRRAIMANTRVIDANGELKGNAFIMSDERIQELFGGSCDVVVPRGSWKQGIALTDGRCFVTMEVQEWHETVYTNDQGRINLVAMNTDVMRMSAAKTYFAQLKEQVKAGSLLDDIANVLNHQARIVADEMGEVNWADLSIRYNAAEWVARGLDLRSSESLLRLSAEAKGRLIRKEAPVVDGKKKGRDKVKIPQPCTWYMQLIPQTAARFFGYQGKVTPGEARVWDKAKMIVVHDVDYLANYINWGGSDLDDFFEVAFRTYKGVRVLIPSRSPKGFGEYAVLKYHDGDRFPSWNKADGTVVTFPEVKGTLPKQLSAALADGTVTILPLENVVDEMYTGELLTRDDVKNKLKAAVSNSASAGMLVNAVMLWSLVMKAHLPIGFGTLENYVDLTTQEDLTPEAAARLRFLALFYINYVANSGRPVDKKFWEDRGFGDQVVPVKVWKDNHFEEWLHKPEKWTAPDALNTMSILWASHQGPLPEVNLVETGPNAPISVQWRHVGELIDEFIKFVKVESQKATPPKGLVELGEATVGQYGDTLGNLPRAYGMAQVLRDFRTRWLRGMLRTPDGQPRKASSAEWDALFDRLYTNITTNVATEERYGRLTQMNRVLGLALVSYRYRTSEWWCQYHDCNNRASGILEVRGVNVQLCAKHTIEIHDDRKLAKNVDPAHRSDNVVTNRAVFRLYMEAMEFYGICGPLEYDRNEGLEWDWDVACTICGTEHTFHMEMGGDYDVAERFQWFKRNQEICNNCLRGIEAALALNEES